MIAVKVYVFIQKTTIIAYNGMGHKKHYPIREWDSYFFIEKQSFYTFGLEFQNKNPITFKYTKYSVRGGGTRI